MTPSTEPSPDPHVDSLLAEAGWVLAFAKRLARDQAAAEDIAQSTLTLALELRPSAEGGVRAWLAKIASTLARRSKRSDVRRQDREVQTARGRETKSESSAEVLDRFELQQDLAKRVSALPEPYRGVLIRRYYEGLSVKEIAAVSGASSGTVRSQLARGIERVRLQYDNDASERSPLGAFLFAAGVRTDIASLSTAEILVMQTSIKVAIAAAAILTVSASFIGINMSRPEVGNSVTVEAPIARNEVAPVEHQSDSILKAPAESGRRSVTETVAAVAEIETPTVVETASSEVSRVHARIFDEDRRPLAGATLSSIAGTGRAGGKHRVAYSDFDGRVVLELTDDALRMGRSGSLYDMTFSVTAKEHATEFAIKLPVLHGDADLGDFRLGTSGVLFGTIVDTKGRTIEGAVLHAGASVFTENPDEMFFTGPSPGVERPQTISGPEGEFELSGFEAMLTNGTAASVRIWAHAAGKLWTVTEPFSVVPRGQVDVGRIVLDEVPPEHRIEGIVIRPDGLPATGARIDFMSTGRPVSGHVDADENGSFQITARKDYTLDLVARDAEGEFGMSSTRSPERGEFVELLLTERRSIAVSVVDTGGEPISDAHLRFVQAEGNSPMDDGGGLVPGNDWEYTDEAGHIDMEVPGGNVVVWARRIRSGSVKMGPFNRKTAPETLTIVMARGAELTGRVLAYGVPVEGARVAAMRRHESFVSMTGGFPNRYPNGVSTVATDAEGRFVAPLRSDWSKVGVLGSIAGMATGEIMLDVEPGESVRDLVINLTEGGVIEGAVTPPPGMEAAGLFIAASRGDGLPKSAIVDANGRYRLEGLTPGEWRVEGRLRAVRTEMLSISRHPDDVVYRPNVVVRDRKTVKFDVDMSELGDVEVHGQLRIDDGVPPLGWVVEVVPPRHARGPIKAPTVELDKDGRFVITARPGRADLRFVGSITGGAMIEMLREVQIKGPRLDWEGTLMTAPVLEYLEGDHEQARFVRGDEEFGDREFTVVPVREDGVLEMRVPVGSSTLQVLVQNLDSRASWDDVQVVEVQ